jgi:uncharacterized protein (DUF58 family)
MAAGAAVALVVAAVGFVWGLPAKVSVRRSTDAGYLEAGRAATVTIELSNDGRLAVAAATVVETVPQALAEPDPALDDQTAGSQLHPRNRDGRGSSTRHLAVPALRAGERAMLTYPVRAHRRGRFTVGPLRLRVTDPFEVARRITRYPSTKELVVYPPVEALSGEPSGQPGDLGANKRRRTAAITGEFATMREYVRGDDLRRVHWPSTARRQQLMVRQDEQAWRTETTVLCAAMGQSSVDRVAAVTASVVSHLIGRGHRLRLLTPEGQHAAEQGELPALLERLADLQPAQPSHLAGLADRISRAGRPGMLVAVVAASAGGFTEGAAQGRGRNAGATLDAAAAPDESSRLALAGQAFTRQVGLVVGTGQGGAWRAARTAESLRGLGWMAAPVGPTDVLADRWAQLDASRTPHSFASRPDAGQSGPRPPKTDGARV